MKILFTTIDAGDNYMAEPPPYTDSDGGDDGKPAAGSPRWVKALGVIALVLVLMFVILHLTYGGFGGHAP